MDTADNPFTCPALALATTYQLFLSMGVIRFAGPAAGIIMADGMPPQDFTIAPLTSTQFGDQPHMNDPQAAATASEISVLRRPLIDLNVRFDSSVLWDGRDSITNLRQQVEKAAKSLLRGTCPGGIGACGNTGTITETKAEAVAAFMLGVEIDTVTNTSAGEATRFQIGLTDQQHEDLIAFLNSF